MFYGLYLFFTAQRGFISILFILFLALPTIPIMRAFEYTPFDCFIVWTLNTNTLMYLYHSSQSNHNFIGLPEQKIK